MGRCLKKGDRWFSSRMGNLVIMPKPQLHGSRGTALRHSHTHHLLLILVPLNRYGIDSKLLSEDVRTLLQVSTSSNWLFGRHGIKLRSRTFMHMSSIWKTEFWQFWQRMEATLNTKLYIYIILCINMVLNILVWVPKSENTQYLRNQMKATMRGWRVGGCVQLLIVATSMSHIVTHPNSDENENRYRAQ